MNKHGFTTLSLNVPYQKKDPHGSLQMPVYDSVAYEFDTAEQMEANFKGEYIAHVYSRSSSPTVEYFEMKLKKLTDSYGVLAVTSGMAAIADSIFAIARDGDNIVSGDRLFGHTFALFTQTFAGLGIEVRLTPLDNQGRIEKLIDKRTRAIYFETVTNPQLEIADIEMLALIAQKYDLVLISDSTLTPPNIFRAGELGIDVEVISSTKHLSGGATSFGGAIVDHGTYNWELNPNLTDYARQFGKNALIAKLRKNIYRNTGSSMSPQTARLMIQGLDILELRVEKCYQNCMLLGEFLKSHPRIHAVGYPGLVTDPAFPLAKKYFSGVPGTVMTFDLESKAACFEFMNRLKIVRRATNLNDNKSLIIHPWSTIYVEFSEEDRIKAGIRDTMMRFSPGIENTPDLIEDINQALG